MFLLSKRVVVISDVQAPFEDRRAVRGVIRFIGDTQPDEVVFIGDCLDFPQPSRWNKDSRGEFEGSIHRDTEYFKRTVLEPLREVYDGPVGMHEGNHDERPRVYLDRYAPALSGTDAFDLDVLLDFDTYGIRFLPEFYDVAPGWISTHGHRGGIRLTQEAGKTALNAAVRFGKSVVMGHTHRIGLQPKSLGYDGKVTQTLWGFEVGNLMDMRRAGYLKGAAGNWQQGFGILDSDAKHTKPMLIPIHSRRFIVDGETWHL